MSFVCVAASEHRGCVNFLVSAKSNRDTEVPMSPKFLASLIAIVAGLIVIYMVIAPVIEKIADAAAKLNGLG
jgi:hypothetical protein